MDQPESPNNHSVSIYTVDQQTGDQFPSSSGSELNKSIAIIPSSELSAELLAVHKKRSRKEVIYISILLAIFCVIGLIMVGVSLTQHECDRISKSCAKYGNYLFSIGLGIVGIAVLIIPVFLCFWKFHMSRQWKDFHQNTSQDQLYGWQLCEDEWQQFLNYIHGPERQWREVAPLSSFCCRRATYERLSDRQYGHIIFYKNGFIIDELYFISFRSYSLLGMEILNFGSNSSTLGLRVHTCLAAGKNSRNIYFDLFAPSTVPREDLLTLTQWCGHGVR